MQNKYLQIWEEYCTLEKEFKEIISHIPLVENHLKVWSFKIGDLLIVLGSVMDSFFKLSLNDKEFDNINMITELRNKERHDMSDYRNIFENKYHLSIKKVYIRRLDIFCEPFKLWSQNKSPDWWEDHQAVKHNRFINKEKAQLESLLNGMAGLFLLNVIHLPNRLVLRRLNQIKTSWSELGERYMEECICKDEPVGDKSTSLEMFYIETELFGYVYKSLNPESTDDNVCRGLLALLKDPRI